MSNEQSVHIEFRGHLALLRLNRPDQLNAFSAGLIDGLAQALDEIDRQPDCRVIVISGNGRAFSAGGDLKEFRTRLDSGDHDGLIGFIDRAASTLTRVEHNPRPVIAAVNGVAVAGGLELILCCDIVIAARGVMIGDGHLRYGVLPGGGGATRLVRKVGPNVASRMLLTGDLLPAEYLYQQGLVTDIVEAEELETRATDLAERIALLSPLALSHVKRVAREAADGSVHDGLKLELETMASYVYSKDFAEGLEAFDQRRQPDFPAIDPPALQEAR